VLLRLTVSWHCSQATASSCRWCPSGLVDIRMGSSANSIQHTAYSIQHTAYSIQHTAYSIQHTAYSIQHTAHSIQHVSWQQAELCRAEKEMTDQKEMADVVFAEMSATPHASDCGDYSSPNYWQPLSRVLPFATCPANTAAPDDLCRDGHVQSLTNGNFPVSVANLSSCNSTCTVLLARTIRYARKTSSAL